MIRREHQNDWLLISQVDHAHLAGRMAAHWGNETVPALPLRDDLVDAVRFHDDGWREWEQTPEVNPQTGQPRNFTEMPLATSVKIWQHSIDIAGGGAPSHARPLRKFREHLAKKGRQLSGQNAAVLAAVLSFRTSFREHEIVERAADSLGVTATSTRRILSDLVALSIITADLHDFVGDFFRLEVPLNGSSPLGGTWVSRHFCWLAEQALQHRDPEAEDLTPAEEFLLKMKTRQEAWQSELPREFAGYDLPRVLDTGFRYVQFFDRISLWLCCADRDEPQSFGLPGGREFEFRPVASHHASGEHRLTVAPWPFNTEELLLAVPVRRIPAKALESDQALGDAIAAGSVESVTWRLQRPDTTGE